MSAIYAPAEAERAPYPAMPPRPARPLSTLALLRAVSTNSLAACDEELFDELFVARRYVTQRVYFISDPAGVKQVFVDKFDNYPRVARIRRLFEEGLGTGSLAVEGETWWRHRRLAAPTVDHRAFLSDIPEMIAITERFADELERDHLGREIDIEDWVGRVMMQLWNYVVTGGDPDAMPLLDCLAKFPRKPRLADFLPVSPFFDPFRPRNERQESVVRLDAVLYRLIDERLDSGYAGRHDVIWRLAHTQDRKTGDRFTRTEIRDECASVITGGIAPSMRTLTWVWYLLDLYPEVEAKLHAELDAMLSGLAPTPELLTKLGYARQVIDETMRIYPPFPGILRESVDADEICGHRIEPKSIIAVLPWVMHRHRRLWVDPDRFDPERFSSENSAARPRFAYLPFAAGPRVCAGAAFAMSEMLIVLVALARRFRIRLVPGHPIVPVGRISLQPEGGMKVTVERRRARA